jgi:alkylmercury lyase
MQAMRRSADAGVVDGFDAFARALQSTFPARDDAPLALALLRLLGQGRPVTAGALAQATDRTEGEVVGRLRGWHNVERDQAGHIVAFSGLALRPTAHAFRVGTRQLHTWCAWDTLFLPALLREIADVRSACPVTRSVVELVVAPDGVTSARPADLHVSFPPLAATDTADITGSFCCHVFFLAGADAARRWRETRVEDSVFDVDAAFELGRRAVAALLEPGSSTVTEVSR